MIAGYVGQVCQLPVDGHTKERIIQFINQAHVKKPEVGKYELNGDDLFVLVQNYEARELHQCTIEAHSVYADVQYILSGYEDIYIFSDENVIMTEDKRPENDIYFYETADLSTSGCVHLSGGMFAYFEPGELHMPCVRPVADSGRDVKKEVIKLVFKIKRVPEAGK